MLRIAFLLPHVLGFLKRRRLSCPGFHHTFVVANMFFVVAKVIAMLVGGPDPKIALLWWLLLVLSAVSIVAQRGCLHHLRSSMPTPRCVCVACSVVVHDENAPSKPQQQCPHVRFYP